MGNERSGLMTFTERSNRKWVVAVIFSAAGFVLAMVLTAVLIFFALFVAVDLSPGPRTLIVTLVLFAVAGSYFTGWTFRGMFVSNIDTLIRDMGPIQRKVLMAAIEEELNANSDVAKTKPPRVDR
jgi:hypothetical protein